MLMLMLLLLLLLVVVVVVYVVVVKRREEKRKQKERGEDKRGEEKRREGKGREEQEQENSAHFIQTLHRGRETSTSHDSTKQKGEKHPGAGEEQERNKEANNIKDVQGLKNQEHIC